MEALAERMKIYEQIGQQSLIPMVPVIARLDGRAFHTLTRNFRKPFDEGFHQVMVYTMKYLVKQTGAKLGYTQSDEISLLFHSPKYDSQIFFDGKLFKIVSILAAMASVRFNYAMAIVPGAPAVHATMEPIFDCRAANYPEEEVGNYFIWRELDAVRNSIQAAAQANFSHKSLQELSCNQLQEKLFSEKGINWNDYSNEQKRGTYIRTIRVLEKFTADELHELPEKHLARTNPDLIFERNRTEIMDFPILTKIKNRTEVLLYGAEPELHAETRE